MGKFAIHKGGCGTRSRHRQDEPIRSLRGRYCLPNTSRAEKLFPSRVSAGGKTTISGAKRPRSARTTCGRPAASRLVDDPNTFLLPPQILSEARAVRTDRGSLAGTLIRLWPYIWPGDRADLKMRVVWAMVLLLIAKLATPGGAVQLQMGDRCPDREPTPRRSPPPTGRPG